MRRIAQVLILFLAITLSAQEPPAPPPPPQIFAPGDLLLSNDSGRCSASGLILGTPVAKDFAGGHTITVSREDGHLISEPYPRGTTIVVWTVTDAVGQTATTTQGITVKDREAPEIKAPPDVEVTANDESSVTTVNEGEPVVSDNCSDSELAITARRSDSREFRLTDEHPGYPIGITRVTWTVTDSEGRRASASQRIVVKEKPREPLIEAPPDRVANTDRGKCSAFVEVRTPIVRNCPRCTIDASRSDGRRRVDMPYPAGRTTILWTATNIASGLTAKLEQDVTVNDTEGPVIGDVKLNTKELWPPNQRMVGVKVDYEAEDLCGGPVKTSLSITCSEPRHSLDWDIINDHFVDLRADRMGSSDRVYTIYVNAVDAVGNRSMKTATVKVRPPGE